MEQKEPDKEVMIPVIVSLIALVVLVALLVARFATGEFQLVPFG